MISLKNFGYFGNIILGISDTILLTLDFKWLELSTFCMFYRYNVLNSCIRIMLTFGIYRFKRLLILKCIICGFVCVCVSVSPCVCARATGFDSVIEIRPNSWEYFECKFSQKYQLSELTKIVRYIHSQMPSIKQAFLVLDKFNKCLI